MSFTPHTVVKGWGSEFIFANGEYCGKLLMFKRGGCGSMHFHISKDETWYVAKGMLKLTTIDTKTGDLSSKLIKEGDVVHNSPGHPHQLEALEESMIFEVSTPHADEDSYRVFPGDSQRKANQDF